MNALLSVILSAPFGIALGTIIVVAAVITRIVRLNGKERPKKVDDNKPDDKKVEGIRGLRDESAKAKDPERRIKIFRWVWRVAILVIIAWGIRSCNSATLQENARLKQAVVEAAKVRQATVYTFTWFKSSTDYDPRGQEMTLDLAVLQDDERGFEAKMIQNINGIKTAVGSLSLSPLKPGRVVGMWANLQDGDNGNVELNYKGNGLWTGNHQVRRGDGSRRDVTCDIRKKSNL